MTRSPRFFYLGLMLVTGATLALEIVQTRMLSVTSWYHMAFFVISVAMFGMTVGALFVFLRPELFPSDRLGAVLSRYSGYAAISVGLAYLDQICLAPEMVASMTTLVVFTRLALTVSVPFALSGVVVTLALTRSPYPVGRTYGADLIGAAAGCLLVIPLLTIFTGPGAVFAAGAVMAAGAVAFSHWAREERGGRVAIVAGVALLAAGVLHVFTLHGLEAILVKGVADNRLGTEYQRWNSFSRVSANRTTTNTPVANTLWGSSSRAPQTLVDVVAMNIDGLAGTHIYSMRGDPKNVDFLRYDVTAVAYAIRQGSVAVIGVGGGKDLMTALVFGNRPILGIEINPAFSEALAGPYRAFAGLADHNDVRIVTDEARSFLARTDERFDLLQASLIDTWAATGAGAFSLSENALYTTEAWQMFLQRLKPGGVFTVSRWYTPDRPTETARLVSLATNALFATGVSKPVDHIMLVANKTIATILVSNRPFSAQDLAAMRRYVAEMDFKLLLGPDLAPASPILASIVHARGTEDLFRFGRSASLDLTPPTDSRPYFFNQLRLSRPWEVREHITGASGAVFGNLIATLTLLAILIVTFTLGCATILVPGRLAPKHWVRPPPAALAYFGLIGFGFMFTEIAFMQRLSVYLGHPVYSLAVVLFSLILFTGIGSLMSDQIPLVNMRRFVGYILVLVSYIAASALLLSRVLEHWQAAPLAGRIVLSVAALAPAGILMGQAFPAGIRLAKMTEFASGASDPTPWLWGVNGAAGVFASGCAVAVSIALGIDATMYLAATCYSAILLTLPQMMRSAQAVPSSQEDVPSVLGQSAGEGV